MATLFKGGATIRHIDAPPQLSGTLGCVVRDRATNERCILTAAHVIGLYGYAQAGDPVVAMDPGSGNWIAIAQFLRSVPFRDSPGVLQDCDAAIARIVDQSLVSDEVEGFSPLDEAAGGIYHGMPLSLRGARSGVVNGACLHSTGNVVDVSYWDRFGQVFSLKFRGQMLYGLQNGPVWNPASQGGDSGGLVLAEGNQPVGLNIARTPLDLSVAASVCTPIQTVLDALGVDLVLGTVAPKPVLSVPPLSPPSPGPNGDDAPTPAAARAPSSDPDELGQRSFRQFDQSIRSLLEPHAMFGGVSWRLARVGIIVEGTLLRTPGKLVTVPRVWGQFGALIASAALRHRVPLELIVATICTESGGVHDAVRQEPKWESDAATPGQVSAGLMQTLLSTARSELPGREITRESLSDPELSIEAGTAYIRKQFTRTLFDPPLVACAYNAGSLYKNAENRWCLGQYGNHADRFVAFFNDCMAFFVQSPDALPAQAPSFTSVFTGRMP